MKRYLYAICMYLLAASCSITIEPDDIFDASSIGLGSDDLPSEFSDYTLQINGKNTGFRTSFNINKRREPGTVVILFHGNAGNVSTEPWTSLMYTLYQSGAEVIAIDYPGFGHSEGSPTTQNMVSSSRDFLSTLFDRKLISPRDNLVLYGASLGSFPAISIAASAQASWDIDGLVLDSAITSSAEMSDHVKSKIFLGRLFTANITEDAAFDSTPLMEKIDVPIFFMHGLEDESVPHQMSETLAALSRNVFDVWLVPEARHVEIYRIYRGEFLRKMSQFYTVTFD